MHGVCSLSTDVHAEILLRKLQEHFDTGIVKMLRKVQNWNQKNFTKQQYE